MAIGTTNVTWVEPLLGEMNKFRLCYYVMIRVRSTLLSILLFIITLNILILINTSFIENLKIEVKLACIQSFSLSLSSPKGSQSSILTLNDKSCMVQNYGQFEGGR